MNIGKLEGIPLNKRREKNNMSQKESAQMEMIKWLSNPKELRKAPAKIDIANEFDYLGMKYYIFKFKKNLIDLKWLLGVCGGYENESLEHCGHVFSDFQEYKQQTAKEDAIKIIEMIREYWKKEAKKYEEQSNQ
jgi:hypothetical protein